MITTPGILKDYNTNPMQLPKEMTSSVSDDVAGLHRDRFHLVLKIASTGIAFADAFGHSAIINNTLDVIKSGITSSFHSSDLSAMGDDSVTLCQSLNKLKKKVTTKETAKVGSKISSLLDDLEKVVAYHVVNFLSTAISVKVHYDEYKAEKKKALLTPDKEIKTEKFHFRKSVVSLIKVITDIALFALTTVAFVAKMAAFKFISVALLTVKLFSQVFIHKADCNIYNHKDHKVYPLMGYSHKSANNI